MDDFKISVKQIGPHDGGDDPFCGFTNLQTFKNKAVNKYTVCKQSWEYFFL